MQMKKLFLISTLILTLTSMAQEIRYENGKFGMINSSGKALLPYEYDHISNIVQFGRKSPYYKLRQGNKYGLYSTLDFRSTGCVYDSLFIDYNLIHLRNDTLFGFVAQKDNAYQVIEPQYQEIYPMNEMHNYGHRPILSLHNYNISAKKNGLWGIVTFANASEVLPFRYQYEVSYLDDNFFVMEDTSSTEVLINPFTLAEFRCDQNAHRTLNDEKSALLIYDRYEAGSKSYHIAVYNYETGFMQWEFTSTADRVRANFETEQIVQVHEEFHMLNGIVNDETNTYTFFNVTNGAPLLSHEGRDHCLVETEKDDRKITVYVTERYNSRRKVLGEIYK
jgi:hypothetical protein